MIIYDVLQHYYDELCSSESWSSLLTSQEKHSSLVFKDVKVAKCLDVSPYVSTLKHKAKHRYNRQLKETLLGHISVFSFVF